MRKKKTGKKVDKQAYWSHCCKKKKNKTELYKHEQSSPTKNLMDMVTSETREHLATLRSWGEGEESKFRNIFLSLTSSKQMAMVPVKSPRCDEKF